MLSHLDFIIFPDRCEVIEIIPSQRYFYPIFKNASSSVIEQGRINKWKTLLNNQIYQISTVDVVIREPGKRFISGVNSFVKQTITQNPTLDQNTIFWFAKNYLHVNRHYCMQFSWLLNLARYLNPTAKINLLALDDIKEITDQNLNTWGDKDESLSQGLLHLPAQEMYTRIDQILFDLIGHSLTFAEIIEQIQTYDYEAYKQVILRAQTILNPTYVVSKT